MSFFPFWKRGLALLFCFLFYVPSASADMNVEYIKTCQSHEKGLVVAAAIEAATKVGIDPRHLLGLLFTETRFGNYLGEPFGVLSAHPSRDLVPLIALARAMGLNPAFVCVSKHPNEKSYGGAIGVAQIMPYNWLSFAGLEVRLSSLYDDEELGESKFRVSSGGIALSQATLNAIYKKRPRLEVDGLVGNETLKRVALFQRHYMSPSSLLQEDSRCRDEVRGTRFGTCTLFAILDKWKWDLVYKKENDVITPLLGSRSVGPPNPWDLRSSLIVSALMLKQGGVRDNPTDAFARYFAGGNFRGADGRAYAEKVWHSIEHEVPKLMSDYLSK